MQGLAIQHHTGCMPQMPAMPRAPRFVAAAMSVRPSPQPTSSSRSFGPISSSDSAASTIGAGVQCWVQSAMRSWWPGEWASYDYERGTDKTSDAQPTSFFLGASISDKLVFECNNRAAELLGPPEELSTSAQQKNVRYENGLAHQVGKNGRELLWRPRTRRPSDR